MSDEKPVTKSELATAMRLLLSEPHLRESVVQGDLKVVLDMLERAGLAFEKVHNALEHTVSLNIEAGYAGFVSELRFREDTGGLIDIRAWE